MDHDLIRTFIVAGVGLLVSALAWLIKAQVSTIAADVRHAVERLNVHATEIAKHDLRIERLETDVRDVRRAS